MVEETKAGPVVRVRAKPQSSKDAVTVDERGVRVEVRAAPERGKANDAVLKTLASFLRVAPSTLSLVSGASSRDKRVLVGGLTADQVRERLGVLL